MASPPPSFHTSTHGHNVDGTTVFNIAGGAVLGSQQQPYGLALLREKASPNAHHNGERLAGPTRCDPDTRVAIIDDIVSFIQGPATAKPVFWLNGAAGTGKSAIALSVAAKCQELGLLAAMFMFGENDPSRNSLEHFVPTIADQIATMCPIIGKHIDRVVSQGPLILRKAVEAQWEELVIDAVRAHPHQPRAVIIIDGADECKDRITGAADTHQQLLLDLVWLASQTKNFPFVFLITSRCEPVIVNIITSARFKLLVQSPVTLGETPESREEMRTVATRNVRERGERYSHILAPDRANGLLKMLVDWMVDEARGEWIFIITICRDLDQSGGDPYKRLADIRRSAVVRAAALAPLDHLYISIVIPALAEGNNLTTEILLFITSHRYGSTLELSVCAQWFGVSASTIRLALKNLHSVINIPQDDDGIIKFHHKTFYDFLFDRTRSDASGLDRRRGYARLSRRCFEILRSDDVSSENFYRASFRWMDYCYNSSRDDHLLLVELKAFNFGRWIENWSTHKDDLLDDRNLFVLMSGYADFRVWVNQWASPPHQFRPDALDDLIRKFLAKLAHHDPKSAIPWLTLLVVTQSYHVLDWDGFLSLYRDHLDFTTIPPLLRDYHCATVCWAFDLDFFRDSNRAQRFCIDGREGMDDFTLACLSVLARGEGTTDGEHSAFNYAKVHWPIYFDKLRTSRAILETLIGLPDTIYRGVHPRKQQDVTLWLKKFKPPSTVRKLFARISTTSNAQPPHSTTPPHLLAQASALQRKLSDSLRPQ